MQFYGDNFVVTNHVCSKEEAATTFSLLLHILAFSWHSKVFVHIVGTPQLVRTTLACSRFAALETSKSGRAAHVLMHILTLLASTGTGLHHAL